MSTIVVKRKPSDTGRTGTTPTADPDLAGFSITSGRKYQIEGRLFLDASGTGPDARVRLSLSNTVLSGLLAAWATPGTGPGDGIQDAVVRTNPNTNWEPNLSTTRLTATLHGAFEALSSGTLDLEWSTRAGGGTTTMRQGSWIRVTEVE